MGPLINHFVVSGSGAFTKVGMKLRPLGIVYSAWAIEYNIRIYDDRFTPDDFGCGPRMPNDRNFEFVHSIGITIPFLTEIDALGVVSFGATLRRRIRQSTRDKGRRRIIENCAAVRWPRG